MNKIDWKAIIIFFALALVFDVALAKFAPPISIDKNVSNTLPPINIGTTTQTKYGGLKISGLIATSVARVERLGVGAQSTSSKSISAAGDIRATQFCLPSTPTEDNCISSWLDAFGISGTPALNSLVRWATVNGAVGGSALYDDGSALLVGKPGETRNLEITGTALLNAPAGTSGLKLKSFIGAAMPTVSTTTVLSVDSNGKIILARADCGDSGGPAAVMGTGNPPAAPVVPAKSVTPVLPTPPATPTTAPVAVAGNGQVTVSFATGLTGATSYNVYANTSNSSHSGELFAACVVAPFSPCTITGLTNGTSYYFWYRGVNSTGVSAGYSPVSTTAVTPSAPAVGGTGGGTTPVTPTNKSICSSKDKIVSVLIPSVNTTNAFSMSSVAMSADGRKQAISVQGELLVSGDAGSSWSKIRGLPSVEYIAMSANGNRITTSMSGAMIYVSDDFGVTWSDCGSVNNWMDIAMSDDGEFQTAIAYGNYIYTSSDFGATWKPVVNAGQRNWRGIAASSDGSSQIATDGSGTIYASRDSGANWVVRSLQPKGGRWAYDYPMYKNAAAVAMSANGQVVTVGGSNAGGLLLTSDDGGLTWTQVLYFTQAPWQSIAMSDNGTVQFAVSESMSGAVHYSVDSGKTWTILPGSVGEWQDVAVSALGAKRTVVGIYTGILNINI